MASAKVTTPLFRASFLKLWKPEHKVYDNGDEADVYSVTMIFEPDADLSGLKRIVKQVLQEKFGATKTPILRLPFREGVQTVKVGDGGYDLEKYPEYEGKIIVTASSKGIQPGIIDAKKQDILDPKELYSGIYARASLTAFYYNNSGGKGVAFGLQNFQKCRDGEPLGGVRGKAENDFDEFEQPVSAGFHDDLLDL